MLTSNSLLKDKNRFLTLVIALLAGVVGGFLAAWLISISGSQASAPNFNNLTKATVTVRARIGTNQAQTIVRTGTGLAVKPDQIITNLHVVDGAQEIFIRDESREVSAKIVAKDPQADLALLKAKDMSLEPARFARASDIKLGDRVFALGKPFLNSKNFTLTSGIVSSLPVDLPKGSPKLMQTDAVVNAGNSGGPLVNENGDVLGITTAYLSTGENVSGIGFAIPVDVIMDFIENSKPKK